MKRQIFFGTMLAAALGIGVGAQAPQAGQAGQPATPAQERGGKEVTVTGCLQAASSTATAQPPAGDTTARQPTGSQSSQFILTSASTTSGSTGSGAAGAGTGTAGTPKPSASATTGSAGVKSTYRLTGDETANLQQYVNSRVEVVGTVQENDRTGSASGSAAGTGATGSATGTGTGAATGTGSTASSGSMAGGARADRNAPALQVTSVRQVSPSCSGGEAR